MTHTVIASLAHAMVQWMRETGASQATVVQEVVEAHDRLDGPRTTRIAFDPPTRDTHERMKINAERVMRWLDELTKSTNLLPVNFMPSLLAGMPMSVRLQAANEILRPADLGAHPLAHDAGDLAGVAGLFRAMLREGAEAEVSVADLIDGADLDELVTAQRELLEDIAIRQQMLATVEAALAAREGI